MKKDTIPNKNYNNVAIIIYTLMGCFQAANQSLVQNIAHSFGASDGVMGYMVSALYGGSMAAVLFEGELAEKIGKRKAAFATAMVVCLGSLALLLSNSAAAAVVGFFLYGMGVGGYESINSSLVADNNKADSNRVLNTLQALFSAGAVFTPLLISLLLKGTAFRPLYAISAVCYGLFALYFLNNKSIDGFASAGETSTGFAFLKLMKNRLMLLCMLAMFIHIGSETALTYWAGSYFSFAGMPEYGSIALSAYWFSSIIGRIIGSRVRSARTLMAPCFVIAAIGVVLLLVLPSPILKVMAVIMVGVAFAPLYAGLTLIAGELFPENSASAFSIMIFSAGIGGVTFQPMISLFVSSGDPRWAYLVIAGLCLITAVLMGKLAKRYAK